MSIKEQLQTSPEEAITALITDFVNTSPLNLAPSTREWRIFGEPLVRFAAGDDPLFTQYKEIIDEQHMTPQEAVAQSWQVGQSGAAVPEKLSIISYILPVAAPVRIANRGEKEVPARLWSHQRYYGELFNNAVRQHISETLSGAGYLAVAPMIQPYFRSLFNEKIGLFSVWSERHVAFAAGQGSFGLSDGFITPKGIAHRCGSVITDLPLTASGRDSDDHHANCVYYADGTCKACAVRCPAGAITEAGHDKSVCMDYFRVLGYVPITQQYDDDTSVYGCGLCQTRVPCEYRIPMKILAAR